MKSIESLAIGWDVSVWSKGLDGFERILGTRFDGKKVLEIGCGKHSGGVGLWFAGRGADVLSSSIEDVSEDVRVFFRDADLLDGFSFRVLDVTELPFEGDFDLICFKSVLGGIARDGHTDLAERALRSINDALKTDGAVCFVENLSATFLHSWFRKRWGAGRNGWYYFQCTELDRLCEDAGFEKIESGSHGFLSSFGRREWQRTVLGKIDGFLCPLLPGSCHAIGWGVWRKKQPAQIISQ